jgi:uncharacterized protein (TIGR02246 family)
MGRYRWLMVLWILALTPTMALAGASEDVGAVVDRWMTAFNANDVDALVKLYAPDAILVGTAGLKPVEGSAGIHAYFSRLAKSGDKVVIDSRKTIVLDNNNAYVTGFYTFSAARNGEIRKSPAGFTMVLSKRGDDWLIVHHHSSRRSQFWRRSPIRRG